MQKRRPGAATACVVRYQFKAEGTLSLAPSRRLRQTPAQSVYSYIIYVSYVPVKKAQRNIRTGHSEMGSNMMISASAAIISRM